MYTREQWPRSALTASLEPRTSKPELFSDEGSGGELQGHHPPFEDLSTRDVMAEEGEQGIYPAINVAGDDFKLIMMTSKSQRTLWTRLSVSLPRCSTRIQETKTFNVSEAAMPSDDSEEDSSSSEHSISCGKARFQVSPQYPTFLAQVSPYYRAVCVKLRVLIPRKAVARLKPSQPSPPAKICGGCADYEECANQHSSRGSILCELPRLPRDLQRTRASGYIQAIKTARGCRKQNEPWTLPYVQRCNRLLHLRNLIFFSQREK
jgi:hypothetical protein